MDDNIYRLHLHNRQLLDRAKKSETRVGKAEKCEVVKLFGFHVNTSCGMIPQDNTWNKDWIVSGNLHIAYPLPTYLPYLSKCKCTM